ncbi:phosphate ABC transporter permease subunit PstC [Cellulosimicrobium composti]|uniref:Phosphate transport system permease protein n=1 Tax=Cellulosimicrobium composti TaxID=2672572 RepID=A0A6N7ZDY4_9MICO|nr:phosphate ABC transporter permease subunit PstC [Cellulosimicrobium composti]MTG87512.1 phosphate ABC transporter permease subunit PstC [Cellulosimicrobium composti]NDO87999.1 phosphate ABC transporter permease subunit PstC [Cellulosimicrobium composti]TWG85361.1 phosphate transport system permease protein [Cellulosimicrobium cellulans J34]SMF24222.1 phosphate ABC transporter membrane protein 1, PhoT family (TC 3.A.1.7.1) [Cellulosimicrobium cellulans J1]
MTTTDSPTTPGPAPGRERGDAPRAAAPRRRARTTDRGLNRVFRWTATGAGGLILGVLAAVAIFLVLRAWPALTAGGDVLGEEVAWFPEGASLVSFVGPLVFGTLLAAALSLVLATPVAMGIALFISHYAPRRLASTLGYVVDLLAAIPSVVYGLWGSLVLPPVVVPVWSWLADTLGWFPLFAGPASPTGRVLLTVALVLAVMILPIITAVSREVFLQTPKLHEEAALALGATRWEMIRTAVLPFGRSGVVSAAMLGLGRALGETMAVLMILSPGLLYSFAILQAGQQQTIAANIAADFPEANPLGVSALIATGLALFLITLLVNMGARAIVARRKDFSGAN